MPYHYGAWLGRIIALILFGIFLLWTEKCYADWKRYRYQPAKWKWATVKMCIVGFIAFLLLFAVAFPDY